MAAVDPDLIHKDPLAARRFFEDSAVVAALESIGVKVQMFALHTPGEGARTRVGLGVTLCGRRGTRHAVVTCKDCLREIAKGQ